MLWLNAPCKKKVRIRIPTPTCRMRQFYCRANGNSRECHGFIVIEVPFHSRFSICYKKTICVDGSTDIDFDIDHPPPQKKTNIKTKEKKAPNLTVRVLPMDLSTQWAVPTISTKRLKPQKLLILLLSQTLDTTRRCLENLCSVLKDFRTRCHTVYIIVLPISES